MITLDIVIKDVVTVFYLDFRNIRNFKAFANQKIDNTDDPEVVLDFRGIQIIDAVALGALVTLRKRAQAQNKETSLKNVSSRIFKLLKLLHFDDTFKIQLEGGD
jgi:anti-anti-sigma factor